MKVLVPLTLAAGLALTGCATNDYAYGPGGSYYSGGRYYSDYCRDRERDGRVAGAVVGGVAGAVIGQQVDDGEGAVIGGVLGAVAGSEVGRRAARCDERGAYWDEASSYPYSYRSSSSYRGRYDDSWYAERRCRWVQDYRNDWVRVCPDSSGRYRIVD